VDLPETAPEGGRTPLISGASSSSAAMNTKE